MHLIEILEDPKALAGKKSLQQLNPKKFLCFSSIPNEALTVAGIPRGTNDLCLASLLSSFPPTLAGAAPC
jgi:hypothetical protein